MAKKSNKTKGTQEWADALDAFVRDSKTTTWAKIASKLDKTEGGIRHWRNGTREIKITEFLALCKAAGADPAAILKGVARAAPTTEGMSPREEMMITLFRGLTPEQQRELTLETLAQVDANREVQQRFLDKPLRTYSNEEVRAAYGDVPPMQKRPARRARARRDLGDAMGDFTGEE